MKFKNIKYDMSYHLIQCHIISFDMSYIIMIFLNFMLCHIIILYILLALLMLLIEVK